MNTKKPTLKSSLNFFLLVFGLSLPLWLIGTVKNGFLPESLPIILPFAALMFVCPVSAALILVYQEKGKDGIVQLLKRTRDYPNIQKKIWYIPIVLFWPVIMILEYGWLKWSGTPLPALQVPDWVAPLSFVLFFIGAAGEELGWMGYALDPLQEHFGALGAAILLGVVRSVWHIIPFIQAHDTPQWILWQCLWIVSQNIIVIWIYNNTAKSIFSAIVMHAMFNVVSLVFPNYGFSYDPIIVCILTTLFAFIVIWLWQPKTLSRFRYGQ